jgi:hypothetical protein
VTLPCLSSVRSGDGPAFGQIQPRGALENGVLSGSVQTDSIDLGTLPLLKEHLFALTGSTSRTTRP